MSHFAKVENGVVTQVIVAESDFFNTFIDTTPGKWIQTSYNTHGNTHYLPDSTTPSGQPPLRANYAGVGDTYDEEHDVFYGPSPFPSWILNTTTWTWNAPVAMPTDGKHYRWNESTKSWVEVQESAFTTSQV